MTAASRSALAVAALALAGCSGSGGGDFDDFFERQGFGSTETYVALVRSATFDDLGVDIDIADDETSGIGDATVELDSVGDIASIDIDGAGTGILFDEALGDSIVDAGAFFELEFDDGGLAAIGRFADTREQRLAYHSYGAWVAVDDLGFGELGAAVFGELTEPAEMPVAGTAEYLGRSTGFYGNESDDVFVITDSEIFARADFGAGELEFESRDTRAADDLGGASFPFPDLDAAGLLTIAGNTFDGAILTAGGLVGTADGVFAGPNGGELGGTLYAGDADEAYIAGFGTR